MLLTSPTTMVAFVRQRVSALLKVPDVWGPPEAVELQLLLLLEMRHVASGASQEETDGVTDRYRRHLGRVVPGPAIPLSARLELTTHANEQFVQVLRNFADLEFELASRREQGVLPVAQVPRLPRLDQRGQFHLGA